VTGGAFFPGAGCCAYARLADAMRIAVPAIQTLRRHAPVTDLMD